MKPNVTEAASILPAGCKKKRTRRAFLGTRTLTFLFRSDFLSATNNYSLIADRSLTVAARSGLPVGKVAGP